MKKKGILFCLLAVVIAALAVLLFFLLKPPAVEEIIDPTPKKISEIAGFEEILASPVTAVKIQDLVAAGVKEPLTDEDILQSVNDFLNNSQFSCIGKVPSLKNMNGGGGDYVTLTTEKGEFKFNVISGKGKMWLWLNGYEYQVIGNEGNVFDAAFRLGYERYRK